MDTLVYYGLFVQGLVEAFWPILLSSAVAVIVLLAVNNRWKLYYATVLPVVGFYYNYQLLVSEAKETHGSIQNMPLFSVFLMVFLIGAAFGLVLYSTVVKPFLRALYLK